MKEALAGREGLNKQRGSVWVGSGGGSSAFAISFRRASHQSLFIMLDLYNLMGEAKVSDLPIFLQGPKVAKGETSGEGSNQDGPQAKKHASDKKISADRKKLLKDKKRTLKRL